MNTFKRCITLVATLAITSSCPLGAMKRKDNPVAPNNEIEEKKYKITPKQNPQDLPKTEKLSGFLGEKFYEAMELIKKVGIILNTTYEQEKNTPIDQLPTNSLRQTIKNNDVSEEIFLQQLKTYFSDDAIQFFISWCESTKDSEENDKLFENVINYVLKHENDGDFSIYNEIKTILNKEKIQYPTIEEFNKTYTEQDPKERLSAWYDYKEKTIFHPNIITISDFPIFKKCIDETTQEIGVEIKNIDITSCDSITINTESKELFFDINEILCNHYTDDEIKAGLQHECTHLKNNDFEKITKIITLFLSSASKENLLLLINDENSIKLIQQNTTFIHQFHHKIRELFADKGACDKNNMIHLITFSAKKFIFYTKLFTKNDPFALIPELLNHDDHLALKSRIIFWAKKYPYSCPWNSFNSKNQSKYTLYSATVWFPARQEYSNFAINTFLIMNFLETLGKNNPIQIHKDLLNSGCGISLEVFGRSLNYVVEKGLWDIVQKFFKPDNRDILHKINKDVIGKTLINVIKNERLKIVQEFFKVDNRDILHEIDKDVIEKSLVITAKCGLLDIIREFFKVDNRDILHKIDKDVIGKAFYLAAKNGFLEIVQEFFKEGNKDILHKIKVYDLGWAFRLAARNGHSQILTYFLNDCIDIFKNLCDAMIYFEGALIDATTDARHEIVKQLLESTYVKSKIRKSILEDARDITQNQKTRDLIDMNIKTWTRTTACYIQ